MPLNAFLCSSCAGMWLKRTKPASRAGPPAAATPPSASRPVQGPAVAALACPACRQQTLRTATFHGHSVRTCSVCHGLWLSPEQASTLRSAVGSAASDFPVAASGADMAGEVVGTGIDLLDLISLFH